MHGRVKVRSSEEEKLRKEKERQAKLQVFKNVMEKIQNKRRDGSLDQEMMEYTAKLLVNNPDIYTLWNIRREVLQIKSRNCENSEELSKMYDSELYLTENCLKVNPKSYGAWHQREWVLMKRSDPDWKKELALCNLYLKYDERNFHVWDYRRFVVLQHNTPLEDEFKYTTEKIHENFSNYSAWHYRSKMLTQLYPDKEGGRPIEDVQHKRELEMVESAAFTDPDDTSAWFYQRWLLGAVKNTKQVVVGSVTPAIVTVAFNTSLCKGEVAQALKLYFNNDIAEGEWSSVCGNEQDFVWVMKHSNSIVENMHVKLEYERENYKQTIDCKPVEPLRYIGRGKFNFKNQYSKPVAEELKKQLDSCHQLLELEPESKWTMLTTTVLMHCCDPTNNLKKAIENLEKLKSIDKLRSGYYDDLASKWIIEEYLEKYSHLDCKPALHSLQEKKITTLYHLQYLSGCAEVDLSNQNLCSRVLSSLVFLQNCEILNLQNNKITTLNKFPKLPQLRKIMIDGNQVSESELEILKRVYNNKVEIL